MRQDHFGSPETGESHISGRIIDDLLDPLDLEVHPAISVTGADASYLPPTSAAITTGNFALSSLRHELRARFASWSVDRLLEKHVRASKRSEFFPDGGYGIR
jgi:hypothetical protein